MTSPAELAARYTELDAFSFDHLQRLLGTWGVLSDLSFSDLLLFAPVPGQNPDRFVVLGQVRPTTGATLLRVDLVGQMVAAEDWPLAVEALTSGQNVGRVAVTVPVAVPHHNAVADPVSSSDTGEVPAVPEQGQLECVPVRYKDAPIAVMVRVGPLADRLRSGRLERVYRDVYQRLAAMVAAGDFPYVGEEAATEDAPRVGDGLLLVDTFGRIRFASPNAMSALHRMGVSESVVGLRLSELGVEEVAVDRALDTGFPVIEEVERRPDVIVLLHCTPLLDVGAVTGALVLLRDVTDLRRLDRLLLSKDAAIREVHHRVKNNLQTISSLLRLQARRQEPGPAQEALREAERRVRSIAIVHEILSREPGDEVPFGEIVTSLVRMAEDSVVSGGIDIAVTGDMGEVPAEVATSLAVALAELLQNAVEHAFVVRDGDDPLPLTGLRDHLGANDDGPVGHVALALANDGDRLSLIVQDDGRGLPVGFDIEATTSLGLSIVRDLITSQLGGTIAMRSEAGTVVSIEVPLRTLTGARRY